MISLFTNLFKKRYLEWEAYKEKINFIDVFYWQQKVRNQNLLNISDQ